MLEDDPACERWLRPLRELIEFYDDGDHRYEPDFIVKTKTEKLICEIKRSDEVDGPTVQKKRAAARLRGSGANPPARAAGFSPRARSAGPLRAGRWRPRSVARVR